MKVYHSREAKYFYRNHPDVSCIVVESELAGISVKTELTVDEAVSMVEDLTDMISWITNEEIKWERVLPQAPEPNE